MLKKNRFIENFIYEKIRFFTNLTYNYNNRFLTNLTYNIKENYYEKIKDVPIYEKIKDTSIYENIEDIHEKWKLPDDWFYEFDENGKIFYACHTTKHTQWIHPRIPIGTPMPNGLPYGWEKDFDYKTGREYFICHVGRFISWSPPVPPKKHLNS